MPLTPEQIAEDYCAANPGRSVVVDRIYRDSAGVLHYCVDPVTIIEKAARLQALLGPEQYRLLIDAQRRPDGETISKAERHCIEDLYEEHVCEQHNSKQQ